jgi:hypothetical protein
MRCLRLLSVALVTAAAFATLTVAASPAAHADGYGCHTHDIYVPGGEAHYTECKNTDNIIFLDGWVKDTRADGKCAQVYGYWVPSYYYFETARACPKGTVKQISFAGGGFDDALVYLRVVG